MTQEEVLKNARTCLGPYCKGCPVCNGRACKNTMPGPGAKGEGDTAIRNYEKWREIRVQMDTLCENRPVDTSLELFGKQFAYPFFAGPVGAVNLHYGDKYDDAAYNDILVRACADNGIAAFTGDGTNPQVMLAATAAIEKARGLGVPTVKPWNAETVAEKMKLVRKSGVFKEPDPACRQQKRGGAGRNHPCGRRSVYCKGRDDRKGCAKGEEGRGSSYCGIQPRRPCPGSVPGYRRGAA